MLLCSFSCKEDRADSLSGTANTEIKFNAVKWRVKKDKDYPYRDHMVNDLLYNDSLRKLNKNEILSLLGEPDRFTEGHLYYMIRQRRIGFWPLHTKTLVVKFSGNSTLEWIKIHE